MNDYLSDMLTRIRNGQSVRKLIVKQRNTKVCVGVLNILWEEGFIRGFNINSTNEIEILLKYYNNLPVIKTIERISKSSRRVYSPIKTLWKIDNKSGIFVISTSKGIMSDSKARQLNIGGEVLCRIV